MQKELEHYFAKSFLEHIIDRYKVVQPFHQDFLEV